MKTRDRFIVIDDDETNNMICRLTIHHALGKATSIETFTIASEGISYIAKECQNSELLVETILLLDINMPSLSGWDTLDILDKLDQEVKKNILVYMLSSSIDPQEKKRAMDHPLVTGFIEKPLTVEKIETFFKA